MRTKKKVLKSFAMFVLVNMLYQIAFPTVAYALTSGPSQPEVQSFEPVGTTEMVDVSTGDFNYNIPLLDVEGYPINISYHGGIGMDQEASWVGLGWNINPGVINRNMRGLPDDFNGEMIEKKMHIEPNKSWGVQTNLSLELIGWDKAGDVITRSSGEETNASVKLNFSLGVSYNNYRGVGVELGISPSISAGKLAKNKGNMGLGFSANSQEGFGVEPTLSITRQIQQGTNDETGLSLSVSAGFNSRSGMRAMNWGVSVDREDKRSSPNKVKGLKEVSAKANNSYGVASSSVSFGTQTYQPNISLPMITTNMSFRGTAGFSKYFTHPTVGLSGYIGKQELASETSSKKAYGYLYTQNKANYDVLLDFNLEKDGFVSENTNNLPVANYTFDLYGVSGQGIGAQYRLYRSDISVLHEDEMQNSSSSGKLGLEVGFGGTDFHIGADIAANSTIARSGVWITDNHMITPLKEIDYRTKGRPLYEPAYFKNVGEHLPADEDFYHVFGYDKAVRPMIYPNMIGAAENILYTNTGENTLIHSNPKYNVRQKRDKRNQMITYLTAGDGAAAALDAQIKSYAPANSSGTQTVTTFNRTDGNKKSHHISELSAINPGGMRYIYGIPAYNLSQEEQSFNIPDADALGDNATYSCSDGLIRYNETQDSPGNNVGSDKFYSKTTTPAYAHSYLLTSVLSPDYVDVTGDGVSFDDDLGTAVKINYYLADPVYHWRTPYAADSMFASYNEGQKSNPYDNKASYIYGKKEIWYVSSIESKNYIAEFSFSKREDGLGVVGRNGQRNLHDSLLKLDKITLYSKKDRQLHGVNAVPVKTVYFEYDYSLCPEVPNNSRNDVYKDGSFCINNDDTDRVLNVNYYKGKLTLKKLYFSYGRSKKAILSPYTFNYSGYNPRYFIKAYDRWGNFKPHPACESPDLSDYDLLSNAEYPYVEQTRDSTDQYATAWSLTDISLPSGGHIEVTYEADDYAYVQDKRAMQMLKIVGVGKDNTGELGAGDQLYTSSGDYYYVYFHLQQGYSGIKDFFRDENGAFPRLVYFNFFIDLKDSRQHHEFVRGYFEIEKDANGEPVCGTTTTNLTGDETIGYIKIKDQPIGDREKSNFRVSPIVKTAWQYARLQRPELVHPGSNPKATGESAIRGLLSAMGEARTMFQSFNRLLRDKSYCQNFNAERSWIRLYNAPMKKLGGGVRVKKIELSDQWDSMAGGSASPASYGQEYEYTTTANLGGTSRTISSGVASYEPGIGNEENPWHQPVYTTIKVLMAPDEKNYMETPFGECFFPSPEIVYSQVTVKNLQYKEVKKHATGKVVHEFYTAKDFPTIVSQTDVDKSRYKIKKILPKKAEDYIALSQGYLIELNDMHGKPKAQKVYAEGGRDPISGVQYIYQAKGKRLNNRVKTFDKDNNTIEETTIATDIDFYMCAREQYTQSISGTAKANVDFTLLGIIPIVLPMLWPGCSSEKTRSRSLTASKVINRYGILQKTVAIENGAQIETENTLYDAHTGEVLLTRTQNEFRDSIFKFTYPAHFAYEGMGQAYKNSGASFSGVILSGGHIILPGLLAANYFYPGDELIVKYLPGGSWVRGWVHKTKSGALFVMDRAGDPMATGVNYLIKVIRSGRRNLQNTPIAHTVSLANPMVNNSLVFADTSKILDAGASVFSDQWGMYCNSTRICYYSHDSFPAQMGRLFTRISKLGAFDASGTTDISSDQDFLNGRAREILDSLCPGSGAYGVEVTRGTTTIGANTTYDIQVKLKKGSCYWNCGFGFLFTTTAGALNIDSISGYTYSIPNPPFSFGTYNYNFAFTVHFTGGATANVSYSRSCAQPYGETYCYCDTAYNKVINPYVQGIRGTWRKKKDLLYLTERTYGSTKINTRKNGQFVKYTPYWTFDAASSPWKVDSTNWTWTSEVTKYSSQGFEIENRDALNRYSAALYASNNLPVAVASNAKLRQIAYDGFEDLDYSLGDCKLEHWNYKNDISASVAIDTTISHTGISSMKLDAGSSHLAARKIFDCSAIIPDTSDTIRYNLKPCDCIDRFSPDTAQKYVLSGWVKDDVSLTQASYTGPSVKVELISGAGTTTHTFKASGRIIEGWQRIDTAFTIPYGTIAINVILLANEEENSWFDDLRIHPFDGNMKSYVYNPVNLKLMAELDENNFATFYEYDEQGALIRVKKETVRGIVTLKESRNSSFKLIP